MNKDDTRNSRYVIRMSFQINGLVAREEITNKIRSMVNTLFCSDSNLSLLQSSIDNLTYTTIKSDADLTNGALIASGSDLSSIAKLAAAIESMEWVGTFNASFKLISKEETKSSKDKITARAVEIFNQAEKKDRNTILNQRVTSNAGQEIFRIFKLFIVSTISNRQFVITSEFVILVALIILIAMPYLVIRNYLYTTEMMIAFYSLLVIGVIWKFIMSMSEKRSPQPLDEIS